MADFFLKGLTSNIPLTGDDDEMKTQLSLLLGTAQLVESHSKGLDLDFYKFIEMFEDGFSTGFLAKQNPSLNPRSWGKLQKNRPKVRVLKESSKEWQKHGYALIELQPDRTNEEKSYILFGTPADLIQQIMFWMNYHLFQENAASNDLLEEVIAAIERERQQFNVRGNPKIKLIFLENSFQFIKRAAKDSNATRGRAQISFRLMDKTNEAMTLREAERLAQKIKAKFIKPIFKFTKGKELYRYYEPKIGDSLRCWTKNQTEAKKLFEQTLDLVGASLDLENARKSISLNPGKAYDDTPGTEIVLGKPTKMDKLRPIVEVEFATAYLMMEGLKKPIYLVDRYYRHKSLISL